MTEILEARNRKDLKDTVMGYFKPICQYLSAEIQENLKQVSSLFPYRCSNLEPIKYETRETIHREFWFLS
jgi:hypothetical protein